MGEANNGDQWVESLCGCRLSDSTCLLGIEVSEYIIWAPLDGKLGREAQIRLDLGTGVCMSGAVILWDCPDLTAG